MYFWLILASLMGIITFGNLREKTKSVKEYAGGLNIGSGNWNFGGSYRYVDAPKSSVAVLDNDLNGYAWVRVLGKQ